MLRFMAKETAEYLQTVREQVKDVENFWPFALVGLGAAPEAYARISAPRKQRADLYSSLISRSSRLRLPRPTDRL
jgi:hypothetical protein